jgi:type IV pilus assembly protein PilE
MQRQSGFTLIEVMITIAIIAILVGIALPSYTSYVTRGKIQEGTTALLAMRVKMEQYFQDNRSYASPGGGVLAPCTAGSSVPVPTLKHFNITCPTLTANTYVIRADGGVDAGGNVIDNALVGLRLEINEANQRWTQSAPGGWGTWVTTSLPKQCWVVKTNGEC